MAGTFSLANKGLKLDSAADLEAYIGPLRETQSIKHIDLSGNTFGVGASEALAPLLSYQQSLESIDLHDIFTSRLLEEIPLALSALLTALLQCPKLHTIDLSDNAFGLKTKDPLVDFLSKHTPLQHLILNNNGMGPIAGTSIADALSLLAERKDEARKVGKDIPDLESIVCGRNRLENGSMAAWAKAYKAHSRGMKSIKMTQNGIRPEGISHLLTEGLKACKSLEVFDMQDNTFTIKGATALAQVIGDWKSLRELGVGDDLLGARGAVKVFEELAKGENKGLEVLRLQYNDIDPKGLVALLKALKDGLPNGRRIELNGNKFDEEDPSIEAISELLSDRKEGFGKEEHPEDHWGLDELDELEGEDSDEEEEGAEEEDDEEEAVLREADEEEDQTVAQKKDKEVDELAEMLEKKAEL
ncbi:putative ran gtpase activating protein 1 (rna1 protein) [Phaeomoniella chlamydospora]|uniref:Putative ran gtpase activating protein 1 (Rna1 protein) n=1 Tax=Phaeomoniella chlamydospora TaxID=158046 RepID=A0A0G2E0Y0_PHACM|nr:putative ran gtpase activating protein 1 (rna1 protein) [Phaeomoniella chlamydospora]